MENIDEKLVEELKQQMVNIPSSITTIEELRAAAEPICEILCNYFNYFGDKEEIIQRIMFYLSDYIGKAITEEDFIKSIYTDTDTIINQGNTNTDNPPTDSNPTSSRGGPNRRRNTNKTVSSNEVVDQDTDLLHNVSNYYKEIQDLVDQTTLTIDDQIQSVATIECSDLTRCINKNKKKITKLLDTILKEMLETMEKTMDIDESIKKINLSTFNFGDIWNTTTKWVESKPLVRADADFFRKQGCTVKDGVTTFVKDGKTYKYNIKSGALVVTDNKTGKQTRSGNLSFDFYIPTGNNVDYSKYNVTTAILGANTNVTNSTGIVVKAGIKNSKQSISQNLIAESTRFMNGVAGTDLTKCQNSIIGGSQWGARSLDIAARTGDLYKTVYCVNNALIVNGKNGVSEGKYKIDPSVLKNLDGKNIYFISTADDPNTYKCAIGGKSWPTSNCKLEKSYLYTGIDILLKNCPNAQVYMVSNATGSAQTSFAKYATNNSNYHYSPNTWNKIMKKDYKGHGYANIIKDVLNSAVVGYNGYNSGTTTA